MSTALCIVPAGEEDSESYTPSSYSSSSPSAVTAPSADGASPSPPSPSTSQSFRCLSIASCSSRPPLAFLAPHLLFLRRRCILQAVAIGQLAHHGVTLALSATVLMLSSDVQSLIESSCPSSLSWQAVQACVLALPGLLCLRSLIGAEFVLMRFRLPELWKTDAPSVGRTAVQALSAASLLLAAVVAGLLLSFRSANETDTLQPLVLLWAVCGLELLPFLLSTTVYGLLHCCLPHSSLSVDAPFLQVDWDSERQDDQRRAEEGKAAAHREVTLAGLQLIPPCIFRQQQHAERLCVICMQDMTEGDRIRLFSCRHAFHQPCADEWLTRRTVCPLCVATVHMPAEALMVEMTGGEIV
jgi:hypothetical protein